MTESPEFRAARERTPEERNAVFVASMRAALRTFRFAFPTVFAESVRVGRMVVPPVDLSAVRIVEVGL